MLSEIYNNSDLHVQYVFEFNETMLFVQEMG